MSTFRKEQIACPRCAFVAEHEVAVSINAARRPALRDAIEQGAFHRFACASCAALFRYEASFTYLDFERGQFLLTFPPGEVTRWRRAEEEARGLFERTLGGAELPEVVRGLGRGMQLRVCFGLAAFREKVLCAAHGLDDRRLELLKLELLRRDLLAFVDGARLIAVDETLNLERGSGQDPVSIDRAALGTVDLALVPELTDAVFVDVLRWLQTDV